MRFVASIRVSTAEQAEEGVSLREQRDRIERWALANDHEIVAWFSDEGVSGTVDPAERQLGAALDLLDRGGADGLVAVKLNRLSRSIRHILDLVERAERKKWILASLTENLDTSTATGRLIVGFLGLLAQFQRDQISEDTTAALRQLKREKKRYSRFAPFGFRISDSDAQVLVADALEQEIASFATETCGMAAMSQPAAARKLQERFGNHPRTGREWTETNVRNLFRSIDRANGD